MAATRYIPFGYQGYNDGVADLVITAYDETGTPMVLPKTNSASVLHKNPNTYHILRKVHNCTTFY